jgi:hypothetical protein
MHDGNGLPSHGVQLLVTAFPIKAKVFFFRELSNENIIILNKINKNKL